MKHLVLGSSGQVGQYVVDELKSKDEEVIEWDIENGDHQDLRKYNENFNAAVRNADFVHFLAYDVGGSKYLAAKQDSFEYIENNMLIMHNVFEQLQITGTPFYFASSQMSHMSHSTYGRLKAVGEAYTHSIGGIVTHFWNVYGIEHNMEKAHVITDFVRMALQDKKILMRTDGTERRNLIYGPDAANILCNIPNNYEEIKKEIEWGVANKRFPDRALPITTHSWRSIREVARIIANEIGDIEIYASLKKDTVQGVENEVPTGGVHWVHDKLFNRPPKSLKMYQTSSGLYALEDGIKEVINHMKKEMS